MFAGVGKPEFALADYLHGYRSQHVSMKRIPARAPTESVAGRRIVVALCASAARLVKLRHVIVGKQWMHTSRFTNIFPRHRRPIRTQKHPHPALANATACIVLHNMVVEVRRQGCDFDGAGGSTSLYNAERDETDMTFEHASDIAAETHLIRLVRVSDDIKNKTEHEMLLRVVVEHVWHQRGECFEE
jgi:hypothetical protein